jgi:hypothetical protein
MIAFSAFSATCFSFLFNQKNWKSISRFANFGLRVLGVFGWVEISFARRPTADLVKRPHTIEHRTIN